MKALKYSRQRESIRDFLATRKDHPTADSVYEGIREVCPNISLGTVYRNLALLEDIGAIIKISTGTGADRYDGNLTPHNHFVCTKCHSVIDLEMENIDHIKEVASKDFDGMIESYITHFYGICGNCTNKS